VFASNVGYTLIHSRNWRQDMPWHAAPRHGVPVPCHRMSPTACRCRARPCRRMVAHGSSWRRLFAAFREVAQARVHWHGVPCGTMECHALALASKSVMYQPRTRSASLWRNGSRSRSCTASSFKRKEHLSDAVSPVPESQSKRQSITLSIAA
jgi:hypothetical protein